jgi:hypothetical protein
MSKKFTGGPAFPQQAQVAADGTTWFEGMDLRDYFAAKAMQGLLQHMSHCEGPWEFEAKAAYKIADAMLVARES